MLYIAYNNGVESAVQTIKGGQSCTTGEKVTLQLGVPSGGYIRLAGWGISFDEDATANAAANGANMAIRSTTSATTLGTAHSTSTVLPYLHSIGSASRLTMSTATTAFGATIPASATTLRVADRRYVPQTSSVDIFLPSDRWIHFGAAASAELVQLIVNTTATVNVHAYMIWEENIA